MHFHLLKDTPALPAMPRASLAQGAMPTRPAPLLAAFDWRAAFAGIARRWLRNRTAATLNAMDDRMLSDIGLRRGDIRTYVAEIDLDGQRAPR